MTDAMYVDKSPFLPVIRTANGGYWTHEDLVDEIWARLGNARRAIGPSRDNELTKNGWITWVKPTAAAPETGFRVYTPGVFRKRKEFAQFVITPLGADFRLSCWVKRRGGRTIYDTQDERSIRDQNERSLRDHFQAFSNEVDSRVFFDNLDLIIEKTIEVARNIDNWTRENRLKDAFPVDWIGMSPLAVLRSMRQQQKQSRG